uniref:Uncharacterized protein n=1 Tax=Chromera velia CCMP2878 TaxID=1169474 RepID=A0A0G4GJ82_9ALVE|eukprot:Cvel_22123.t1-p1 / transcript=Cvel_22123.t1 / gene=Cvel_22123 / organism=Chromera_velia_CCMP2878 / gene_product=hypothetical protein / transcript_product=hypothetical protein / location=Cvel_scaffold2144:10229-10630(+) / protein_length=134 / sequence_SO=supercontig / SO=protein_coding / is_pseudo=false
MRSITHFLEWHAAPVKWTVFGLLLIILVAIQKGSDMGAHNHSLQSAHSNQFAKDINLQSARSDQFAKDINLQSTRSDQFAKDCHINLQSARSDQFTKDINLAMQEGWPSWWRRDTTFSFVCRRTLTLDAGDASS